MYMLACDAVPPLSIRHASLHQGITDPNWKIFQQEAGIITPSNFLSVLRIITLYFFIVNSWRGFWASFRKISYVCTKILVMFCIYFIVLVYKIIYTVNIIYLICDYSIAHRIGVVKSWQRQIFQIPETVR